VTEALAEAGGVLQTGDKKKIYVLRKQTNGNLTPIPVNVAAIYRGQAPDSLYLAPRRSSGGAGQQVEDLRQDYQLPAHPEFCEDLYRRILKESRFCHRRWRKRVARGKRVARRPGRSIRE
jgi:hypothetical protein